MPRMLAHHFGTSAETSRHSLRLRLPLLVSGLVVAVMALFLGAAYREVDASLLRAARERARTTADQVANLFDRSSQLRTEQLRRAAADPDVRRYLQDSAAGSREPARKVLTSLAGGGQRRVTLWKTAGPSVLEVEGSEPVVSSKARPTLPEAARPTGAGVGALQAMGQNVFVDTVAEVNGASSSTGDAAAPLLLGYVAVRSPTSVNPPGILSRMVGNDAVVQIGNSDGDVWTDFSNRVPAPPVDLTQDGVTEYRAANGQMHLGAVSRIRGTRWAVWVEFPRAAVIAPARTFLSRMIVLGGFFALGGAALVWMMTVRITTPLSDMTRAAEAIAAGDYSRRVSAERRDEIGRLGAIFNVMTGQVQEAYQRLEARVQERTRELHQALAVLGKQSEAQESYLAAMVESSDDAIIGSKHNIVQSWNRGAEKLFGYTSLEMIDRPISLIVPSSRPGEATDLLERLNRGEPIRHYETVRVKKDGTLVDVSLTISAIRDHAGRILGASSVARDITERKRAEEALRVSEERYRHLFEQSPDAMLLYDAATLAIIEVNEAAVQQYGYSHVEFTRLTLKEIRPAEDVPRLLEYVSHPVQPDAGVWRHKRKDGSVFSVDVRVYPFTDAGRDLRFAAVRDISERLGLEDRLRQAQKMDAIGQLAGGVAHDFNNLLTAILGYAHMVSEALEEGDARRIDVQEIINAANRAAALTKQLLAFSRKQVLQTTIVNLNALISQTSHMLRRLIGEHIELVTILAADLAPVRADAGQLEQIVINLAVNARDAMPGGGRLSIETANVELDDSHALQHFVVRPGRYVVLAVSDSGVGMNEDTKQRLFEPFFTTKEKGKGTGLGLSTVYGIVKQSEGHISVHSEPGKGAAFKVYLPRAENAAEAAETPAPKTLASGGSEKVLVVEDEEAVRYLTRVLLERCGYRVLDAGNPREAEAVFGEQAGSIDLLLTDVVMPGSNGPALFKRLAERQPGLKVLYMSGYTDDAIIRDARFDPHGAFIQKPFTADGLAQKVREILDR